MISALELATIEAGLATFLWPFLRVTMALFTMPVLGSQQITPRVKIGLAILITLVVMPAQPALPLHQALAPAGILLGMEQVVIGLAIGFLMQLVFAAVGFAGQNIAISMGLGFASVVDPQNGVQTVVVSQFLLALATLLFLAMNGHLAVIALLHDSFQLYPLQPGAFAGADALHIAAFASHMFGYGLLISLPAVVALLLANIAFGVVTRASPQLNIFGVGFPITLILGFFVLAYSLPALLPQFDEVLDLGLRWLGLAP